MPSSNLSPALIRAAVAADTPTIGRLGAVLVQLHHGFDADRFIAPTPETATGYGEFVRTQLGKKHVVVLVAERDGAVIGYVWGSIEGYDYMTLRGPAGVINDVVVDPAHRGQGVGRQLLTAILDALAKLGAPRVVLSTAAKNETAQRLFTSAGFRHTMIEMTRESNTKSGQG